MMREILFRGKRVDNGEWIQGDLLQNVDCLKIREQEKYIKHIAISLEVLPETVEQYTGLTDINGKKIFEGDIIKVEYAGNNKGLEGTAKVVFQKCKFALVWGWHNEIVCLTDFCNVTFEIIGNINDNPELLKGGTEARQNDR